MRLLNYVLVGGHHDGDRVEFAGDPPMMIRQPVIPMDYPDPSRYDKQPEDEVVDAVFDVYLRCIIRVDSRELIFFAHESLDEAGAIAQLLIGYRRIRK